MPAKVATEGDPIERATATRVLYALYLRIILKLVLSGVVGIRPVRCVAK